MMAHTTFFWGKNFEVYFSEWPGGHSGMYALLLLFVFALVVMLEWLSQSQLFAAGPINVRVGVVQTLLCTLLMVLAYILMLALISFNGGVFLAVAAGHAVGFLVFGSRAFKGTDAATRNP